MKKKLFLLSTVGAAAAGLVYALETNRRKQAANKNESTRENGKASATNGRSAAQTTPDKSNGHSAGSMAKIDNGNANASEAAVQHQLDDHGTNQAEASRILREIRDNAFDASDEKLALALGRPTEEIEEWSSGRGLIDGDVVMKARALAMQRGVEVE
jgi:hypothetical protein